VSDLYGALTVAVITEVVHVRHDAAVTDAVAVTLHYLSVFVCKIFAILLVSKID